MNHGYRSCPEDSRPKSATPHPAPFGVAQKDPTHAWVFDGNTCTGRIRRIGVKDAAELRRTTKGWEP